MITEIQLIQESNKQFYNLAIISNKGKKTYAQGRRSVGEPGEEHVPTLFFKKINCNLHVKLISN